MPTYREIRHPFTGETIKVPWEFQGLPDAVANTEYGSLYDFHGQWVPEDEYRRLQEDDAFSGSPIDILRRAGIIGRQQDGSELDDHPMDATSVQLPNGMWYTSPQNRQNYVGGHTQQAVSSDDWLSSLMRNGLEAGTMAGLGAAFGGAGLGELGLTSGLNGNFAGLTNPFADNSAFQDFGAGNTGLGNADALNFANLAPTGLPTDPTSGFRPTSFNEYLQNFNPNNFLPTQNVSAPGIDSTVQAPNVAGPQWADYIPQNIASPGGANEGLYTPGSDTSNSNLGSWAAPQQQPWNQYATATQVAPTYDAPPVIDAPSGPPTPNQFQDYEAYQAAYAEWEAQQAAAQAAAQQAAPFTMNTAANPGTWTSPVNENLWPTETLGQQTYTPPDYTQSISQNFVGPGALPAVNVLPPVSMPTVTPSAQPTLPPGAGAIAAPLLNQGGGGKMADETGGPNIEDDEELRRQDEENRGKLEKGDEFPAPDDDTESGGDDDTKTPGGDDDTKTPGTKPPTGGDDDGGKFPDFTKLPVGGILDKIFKNPAGLGAILGGLGGLLGGSKQSGTITTINDLPDWQKIYAMKGLAGASEAYDRTPPGVSPVTQAGNQYMMDVIGGNYLNSNPYLDAMYDRSAKKVSSGVNALFSKGGRYGSGAHQGVLGETLGNLATDIYGGNYARERVFQQTAAGGAPAYGNAIINQPFLRSQNLLGGVNAVKGGTSSSPYFDNRLGNLLGGVVGGSVLGGILGGGTTKKPTDYL